MRSRRFEAVTIVATNPLGGLTNFGTTQTALTAHLVCNDPAAERSLHDVTTVLRDRFGIGHATLQIETDADAELCRLRPHDVV